MRSAQKMAIELLELVDRSKADNIRHLLTLAAQISDCNTALIDASNNFAGCITGIHEVLRRQGLPEGIWALNEKDVLSPGQKEEFDRVYIAFLN